MRRYGLPKQCLLRRNEDFETVYRHGKRLHGLGFSLIYLKNSRDYSRVGISVSRKIKGAVKRNRIKRIFKESFRLNKEEFPLGSDIVIVVRPDIKMNTPHLIVRAVQDLMRSESP